MINGKNVVAIIPARGGSKGLPGKNKKIFAGKPLIAWTISAARESSYVDSVVVTTDDKKIAEISSKYGAEVPFNRPKSLSSDKAKMIDVVIHCLDFLIEHVKYYDIVVLLQPTSPLRRPCDIDRALKIFIERKAAAVVGVTECTHLPELTGKLPEDLSLQSFLLKKSRNLNRQEISKSYAINGAIYVAESKYLIKHRDWYGARSFAYIMDKEHSVDIDDNFDFIFAEFIMKNGIGL